MESDALLPRRARRREVRPQNSQPHPRRVLSARARWARPQHDRGEDRLLNRLYAFALEMARPRKMPTMKPSAPEATAAAARRRLLRRSRQLQPGWRPGWPQHRRLLPPGSPGRLKLVDPLNHITVFDHVIPLVLVNGRHPEVSPPCSISPPPRIIGRCCRGRGGRHGGHA